MDIQVCLFFSTSQKNRVASSFEKKKGGTADASKIKRRPVMYKTCRKESDINGYKLLRGSGYLVTGYIYM